MVIWSDIYKDFYIPKCLSCPCMLSTRGTESYLRGGGGRKCLVHLSSTHHCNRVTHYSCRAMSRDETQYPDAEKFIPEIHKRVRHLDR